MSKRKDPTKNDDAEALDVQALVFLDRGDITPSERAIAEEIYELTTKLTDLIENGPDPEFADHPSHQVPKT